MSIDVGERVRQIKIGLVIGSINYIWESRELIERKESGYASSAEQLQLMQGDLSDYEALIQQLEAAKDQLTNINAKAEMQTNINALLDRYFNIENRQRITARLLAEIQALQEGIDSRAAAIVNIMDAYNLTMNDLPLRYRHYFSE